MNKQKVVIPKAVAEWLDEYQHKRTLLDVLNVAEEGRIAPTCINNWILAHQKEFIYAWFDGYKVEQERLYAVTILGSLLTKIKVGDGTLFKLVHFYDLPTTYDYTWQLTEQEIKQADKRLWQFAEPLNMEDE